MEEPAYYPMHNME